MEPLIVKRVRVLNGYAAHARFLAEVERDEPCGYIPMTIHQPYRFSATHFVMRWREKNIIICETGQRRYEVFEVPAERIAKTEHEAFQQYLANKKAVDEVKL